MTHPSGLEGAAESPSPIRFKKTRGYHARTAEAADLFPTGPAPSARPKTGVRGRSGVLPPSPRPAMRPTGLHWPAAASAKAPSGRCRSFFSDARTTVFGLTLRSAVRNSAHTRPRKSPGIWISEICRDPLGRVQLDWVRPEVRTSVHSGRSHSCRAGSGTRAPTVQSKTGACTTFVRSRWYAALATC